jgi:hypothetical protein
MSASPRAVSLLTMYRHEVLPLLREAAWLLERDLESLRVRG